ncbi:hypothetical protein ACFFRR_005904 [Megaselia abdita]
MLIEIVLIVVTFIAWGYYWVKKTYSFFDGKNIEHDKPYPIIGSMKEVLMKKVNFLDMIVILYQKFNSSIVGIYDTKTPMYLIRNPEVLRQIAIKDFDHFMNHRTFFDDGGGLFENSLFSMQNQKWKDMRSNLSPAYTGSKLRTMFEFIRETAETSVQNLKTEKDNGIVDIELKDYFRRYANDIIATAAFGFQIDSMKDKENQFFKMGQEVTNFSTLGALKFFCMSNFKTVSKFLNLKFISEKQSQYYKHLVLGAMKNRLEKKIFRPDIINILMETTGMSINGKSEHVHGSKWTDNEIVAQCFTLFFAGFESVSSALCIIAHELMENQEIQEKLREEIEEVVTSLNGGNLTYEALSGMKYMDSVISEALRKWPLTPTTDRVCTKAINIQDPDTGEYIHIKPGDNIMIPIVGLQRDPKYFPDPLKFDPERFTDENKKNIFPNTYLPFGVGPRMCIGMRFALLEIKAIVFYLFNQLRLEAAEKSCVPLKLDPCSILMQPKNGFWVKLVDNEK